MIEPRLDRPRRDPERSGDLREWSIVDVPEYEDRPLLRQQPVERTVDGVSLDDRVALGDVIRWGLGVRVLLVHEQRWRDLAQPPAPPKLRVRRIGDDLVQPPVERGRFAQPRQAPPGRDEGLLRRVGGVGVVLEDRPRDPIAAIDPTRDQRIERADVTVGRARTRDSSLDATERSAATVSTVSLSPDDRTLGANASRR